MFANCWTAALRACEAFALTAVPQDGEQALGERIKQLLAVMQESASRAIVSF
jgi:hypothetical protein